MAENVKNLEDILNELSNAGKESNEVSVEKIQDTVGRRSFAPLLVAFGLIVITPVGGIPGVPTTFGVIVLLLAGQILIGRHSLWLPEKIRSGSIKSGKLASAIDKIRPFACWIDRFIRPRLTFMTQGAATYAVAAACCLLAVSLPPLELVPFAVMIPATAIVAFALSLMSNDGILALIGYIFCAGTAYALIALVPYGALP